MQSCIHDVTIYNHKIAYSESQIQNCDAAESFPQMIQILGFSTTWQIVPDCLHFSRKKTAIALSIFYYHWVSQFGDLNHNIFHALNNVLIEWSHEEKYMRGYSEDGVLRERGRALGLTLTPHMCGLK